MSAAAGKRITTIEGLSAQRKHPLQRELPVKKQLA